MSEDVCSDNRFELIAKARDALLKSTNIEDSPNEMAVLDSILFRCWQMGWLDRPNAVEDCESEKLKTENAELRELVSDMWEYIYVGTERDGQRLHDRTYKLGIEVG